MYSDSIVDEIHHVRHEILVEHGGDMAAYNRALSQKSYSGFKFVRLAPAQPFAWNNRVRPISLSPTAKVIVA